MDQRSLNLRVSEIINARCSTLSWGTTTRLERLAVLRAAFSADLDRTLSLRNVILSAMLVNVAFGGPLIILLGWGTGAFMLGLSLSDSRAALRECEDADRELAL